MTSRNQLGRNGLIDGVERFFFFQAEDGIRDIGVTGVQTCALPISTSFAAPAIAQEGHPLKGSWLGTWGPSQNHADDVLVVLKWDGKAISGTINPGTDNIAIKNAVLTPEGWVVHLEGAGKDKAGKPTTYVIKGK